ncbi:MAG: gfo/Idh/MocA family oxidoreductase [Nitriliruptorales bacterium]|nr:gfo/Idh/MocA family oxidoreductase [Nitriliruptorales bacterium]
MTRPRLAFVGAGWIGSARMRSAVQAGAADAAVVADPDEEGAARAAAEVGCAVVVPSLEAALQQPLDGVVLATPSALHARQALTAMGHGVPVFCQKPLGRTRAECARVVRAARDNDLLLGVDLSYRHIDAFRAAVDTVRAGAIGRVYATDLVFHNAYGPDKPWFTDPAQSGGGCVIDLGTHLVDIALWALQTTTQSVTAQLFVKGEPLTDLARSVEDYAVAQLTMSDGASVRLACSWFLDAGTDAVVDATFHGTDGGVSARNCNGSFYDFECNLYRGRSWQRLVGPGDDWGGRALVAWADSLSVGAGYDPRIERILDVAGTLDLIYGRAS